MAEQWEIEAAKSIRFDVVTNALDRLAGLVADLIYDLPSDHESLPALREAIANAHAGLDVARGGRFDVPPAIRSQSLPQRDTAWVQDLLARTAR